MKCFFFDGAEAAVPWAAVLEGSLDIVLCALVLIRLSFCVGVGGCLEDSNLESDVLKMELCCVTSLAAGREASRDERTTKERCADRVNRFDRKMNILNLSYAVYTITTPLRSRAACNPSLSIYVYVPVYPFQVK
jgi:hypothetical protein